MKKTILLFVIIILTVFSCQKKKLEKKVSASVMGEGKALVLEDVDFTENVVELYAKVSTIDSIQSKFKENDRGSFWAIKEFRFTVFEVESLNILVPKYEYGYVFNSKVQDSLVQFHNMYFNRIKTLTTYGNSTDKRKVVAMQAFSKYKSKSQRDAMLDTIKQIYGQPLLESASSSFDEASYSWVTKNKIIEINTSKGFSFEASTSGETKNYTYYILDVLLVNIGELKGLVDAHIHFYDDNYNHTIKPNLAQSEFLPQLINIKKYYTSNY